MSLRTRILAAVLLFLFLLGSSYHTAPGIFWYQVFGSAFITVLAFLYYSHRGVSA